MSSYWTLSLTQSSLETYESSSFLASLIGSWKTLRGPSCRKPFLGFAFSSVIGHEHVCVLRFKRECLCILSNSPFVTSRARGKQHGELRPVQREKLIHTGTAESLVSSKFAASCLCLATGRAPLRPEESDTVLACRCDSLMTQPIGCLPLPDNLLHGRTNMASEQHT